MRADRGVIEAALVTLVAVARAGRDVDARLVEPGDQPVDGVLEDFATGRRVLEEGIHEREVVRVRGGARRHEVEQRVLARVVDDRVVGLEIEAPVGDREERQPRQRRREVRVEDERRASDRRRRVTRHDVVVHEHVRVGQDEVPCRDGEAERRVRHVRHEDVRVVRAVALCVRPGIVAEPGEARARRGLVIEPGERSHAVERAQVRQRARVGDVVGEIGELVVVARAGPLEDRELAAARESRGEAAVAERPVDVRRAELELVGIGCIRRDGQLRTRRRARSGEQEHDDDDRGARHARHLTPRARRAARRKFGLRRDGGGA